MNKIKLEIKTLRQYFYLWWTNPESATYYKVFCAQLENVHKLLNPGAK